MNLYRCLRLLPIAIACMVFVGGTLWSAEQGEIPRIIFDSDMSSDHDDVGDIAALHGLASLGECKILAMMVSSRNGGTALCMDAINKSEQRQDRPGWLGSHSSLGEFPF